jgi:hypothetical protein
MDGVLPAAINAAILFVTLTVSGMIVMMASTYTTCTKTDFSNGLKNGAITATVPSVAFFVASYLTFIRQPFENLFISFGVEPGMAGKLGAGYLVMLFLWPMIVWGVHESEKKVCVASVDEMTQFKTKLMEKLNAKKQKDAANTKAPVQTPATK